MRIFLTVWLGQVLSAVGTSLTGFALAVWVYQRTGSVTDLALISVAAVLPGMLIAPLTGALIDRHDRRLAMLLSDLAAGLSTLLMAALLLSGALQNWHIYLSVAFNSLCTAVQQPAWAAATTTLVPKAQLGRANGMVQLGQGVAMLIGPAVAGSLMAVIDVHGVIAIDVATFLLAVGVLGVVRFPQHHQGDQDAAPSTPTWAQLRAETGESWRWIAARPGLMGLLVFGVVSNLCLGMVHVLITPLVLSFADEATLGILISTCGVGMLVGSVLMVAWGGPRRRVLGVVIFSTIQGSLLLLGGLQPSAWLVGAGGFGALLAFPIVQACNQTLWQHKVPAALQGRVFSLRQTLTQASLPVAYLAAGPLADRVFEPLLAHQGPLADTLGRALGAGPGRGIGLLFVTLGLLAVGAAWLTYAHPRVRHLERELPDYATSTP